jgi:hypothetical protein
MPDSPIALDSFVDLMAQLIGLTLDPEHRPGVIANMERNTAIAQRVMEFELSDEIEAAPVFQP